MLSHGHTVESRYQPTLPIRSHGDHAAETRYSITYRYETQISAFDDSVELPEKGTALTARLYVFGLLPLAHKQADQILSELLALQPVGGWKLTAPYLNDLLCCDLERGHDVGLLE